MSTRALQATRLSHHGLKPLPLYLIQKLYIYYAKSPPRWMETLALKAEKVEHINDVKSACAVGARDRND